MVDECDSSLLHKHRCKSMDANLINISSIESFFEKLLQGKVSEHIFFGSTPDARKSSWTNFVVVNCTDSIVDMGAFGKSNITVELYAKPLGSGKKNVAVLSQLEERLNDVIKNSDDPHYRISRGLTYTFYDDTNKMHCNMVSVRLLIL